MDLFKKLSILQSIVDRYLSSNELDIEYLLLLGVSSMLIASKFEEARSLPAAECSALTCYYYTTQEVFRMELEILTTLNFVILVPTVNDFLRKFTRFSHLDGVYAQLKVEALVNYLGEISLLDYGCVEFTPYVIAASAVFVARFTIDPTIHPWSSTLQQETGFSVSKLKDCINVLNELQWSMQGLPYYASFDKYNQNQYKCASSLRPPSQIPLIYFEDPVSMLLP